MLVERTLTDAPARLGYAEGPGTGPPMVLLHGLMEDRRSFDPLLPHWSPHHHLFAFDLRGHGASAWTPSAYTLDDDASDVTTLLAERVPPRPVLLERFPGAELMADQTSRTDPECVASVIDMSAVQDHTYPDLFAGIPHPTLLIQADPAHGAALSDHDADAALDVLANGRLARITGSGHMIQDEATEVYARKVLAFLEEVG